MIRRGVVDEVRRALRAPDLADRPRRLSGLDELATLPLDGGARAIVARTRRYAAYQRKWMRRIPGSSWSTPIDRSRRWPDDVLDLARAR